MARLVVRPLAREEHSAHFAALASLRITVFRDWPYLYDGDLDYERDYLSAYVKAKGAVIIAAFAGDRLVGAATAAPLQDHDQAFCQPLADAGYKTREMFYFGESVLLQAYRGHGIGHRFFEEREKAARDAGFSQTVFASVIRPDAHPAKPEGYTSLDGFWRRRGYQRLPDIATTYAWRDVGDAGETPKPMAFWHRQLA
jgi:GNAT superfamily N-acetyltransferase